ncbi:MULTISPECIES: type IV secretion system protein [unclassified Hydrogenophaga]|uniref:type IV secretion system protein n=1 Tax=unclassified Hydrogenophaga TaxID=2610897 RepID=UPI00131FBD14|nr:MULTISPECIES: type IV secretion system protein [unclassified Hydrogenophaga]MDP3350471.1 type IV secretion system protein [Hydrogenophaga sp.]QHE78593.1 type IV secretion system protein [Hydrogenophaga sp. PBL-H3]QHE83018.1 type IV secretion system protein [Hydrogenophaga sp. PBL-H3]
MSFFRKKPEPEPLIGQTRVLGRRGGQAAAELASQPNTPPSVFGDAAHQFGEIYGSSKVEATRWFLIAMLCLVLASSAVGALVLITPLKEVRPWVVEVNPTTGVVNRPVAVERIDPNLAVVKAELARWVEAVYAIDPQRSRESLRWAAERAAGKALGQFTEFRGRERIFERIRSEPEMVREVKITAVDASQRGTAFIFLTTTERVGSQPVNPEQVKRYRVTLNYQLTTATQEADLLENPLGIYVTYFSDAEERPL